MPKKNDVIKLERLIVQCDNCDEWTDWLVYTGDEWMCEECLVEYQHDLADERMGRADDYT